MNPSQGTIRAPILCLMAGKWEIAMLSPPSFVDCGWGVGLVTLLCQKGWNGKYHNLVLCVDNECKRGFERISLGFA